MQSTCLHQTAIARHQADAVRTVDRYWHQLAANGTVPERLKVNPAAIQDALEYTFMAEHLSAGHARLLVAGGSISAVMGMEVAGMPMAVLVDPEMRPAFTRQVKRVFDEPLKLSLALAAPAKFGQPALEAMLRLYPLRHAAGHTTQLIGTFVTTGMVGQTPRRFRIKHVEATPVSVPTQLHTAPRVTRGHLRLVVSND